MGQKLFRVISVSFPNGISVISVEILEKENTSGIKKSYIFVYKTYPLRMPRSWLRRSPRTSYPRDRFRSPRSREGPCRAHSWTEPCWTGWGSAGRRPYPPWYQSKSSSLGQRASTKLVDEHSTMTLYHYYLVALVFFKIIYIFFSAFFQSIRALYILRDG